MVAYAEVPSPSATLASGVGTVWVIAAGARGPGRIVDRRAPHPISGALGAMLWVGVESGAHKTVGPDCSRGPTRRGRVIGAHDNIATFGGVFAPAVITLALPDWRGLFFVSGLDVATLTDGSRDGFATTRRHPVRFYESAVGSAYNGAVTFFLHISRLRRRARPGG